MGFFDAVLSSFSEIGKKVVEVVKRSVDVIRTVASEVGTIGERLIKRVGGLVVDGKFKEAGDAVKSIWQDSLKAITGKLQEAGKSVLDAGRAILKTSFETVETVVQGVGKAIQVATDFIRENPAEFVSIAGSVAQAVVGLATGNIALGLSGLFAAGVKGVKLVEKKASEAATDEEAAEIRKKYDFGPEWRKAAETIDGEFHEVDQQIQEQFDTLPERVKQELGLLKPAKLDEQMLQDLRATDEALNKRFEVDPETGDRIDQGIA